MLRSFLNSLLDGQGVITNLTYLNSEQLGTQELDRKAVFDVYCENDRGEKFLAEYEDSLKAFRDWYSVLSTAEHKGFALGMEEGMAKGGERTKPLPSPRKCCRTECLWIVWPVIRTCLLKT